MNDSGENPSERKQKAEKQVYAESLVECSQCHHLYRQAELSDGHFSVQTSCPRCGYSGDHDNLEFVLKDMTSGTISKGRKKKE
ncbi:MAG: hypothetical protein ACXAB4_13555 [Candidatus Hodarchaeales archaeon]